MWTKPALRTDLEFRTCYYVEPLRHADPGWDVYWASVIATDPMIQDCIRHAGEASAPLRLPDDYWGHTVTRDFTLTLHPEDHLWKPPFAGLAERRVWVAWRGEPNLGNPPSKVPYRSIGRKALPNNPKTWLTLAQAEAVAGATGFLGEYGFGGGVGVMLGPVSGLMGIDLDSCRDPETETIEPWATEVIERLGSYTEVSPSRTGVKIFALADSLPALLGGQSGRTFKRSGGAHPPAIEVHIDRRYFTVTGWRLGSAELGRIPIADFEWLLEEAGPRLVGKKADKSGRDESRSAVAWRLGAALRRQGKSFEEMVEALRADPETAEWTAEKGEINGQRELRKIWDKTDDTDEVAEIVEEFNAKYYLVSEAGKAVIYQPKIDPGLKRRIFDRLTLSDLRALYLNREILVGSYGKRPIYKTAAEVWLRHPDRRQFIGGVAFDPTGNVPADVLNLWKGFAVEPVAGDWSLMRQHVETIICDGDPIRFNYLMDWLARLVQKPSRPGEVAVVMQGKEGTGKGTLANALIVITGQHGLGISSGRHLTGNFNLHLRDCLFLFADEALFAGDRSHIGVLNSLITEPYLSIEGKFANTMPSPNRLHIMMASNEKWVVAASMDSRRYFVLEVSEARMRDFTYFEAILKQMRAGGYAAMLHELLARDISAFNVRNFPTTEGLQRQRSLSLPTTEAWWKDCLERGYVFRSRLGLEDYFQQWHDRVSTELLFQSYLEFAKGRERRPLAREHLGRFFTTALKASAGSWRHGVVGERLVEDPIGYGRKAELFKGKQPTGYVLGTLAEARGDFTRATGLDVAWEAVDEPLDPDPETPPKKAPKY